MKKVLFILLFLSICFIFLGIHLFNQDQQKPSKPTLMTVYIKGGVLLDGQYEVATDTTLQQLIDYAILKESADISSLNLNEILKPNKTYIIPINHKLEKININTATVEELQQINGIGIVIAQAIVDHRNRYGFFELIIDIKAVNGIGDKTYEKIRDYITI